MLNFLRKPTMRELIPAQYEFIKMRSISRRGLKHIARNGQSNALCGSRGLFMPEKIEPSLLEYIATQNNEIAMKQWCGKCVDEYRTAIESKNSTAQHQTISTAV